jgi:hypothetical protein
MGFTKIRAYFTKCKDLPPFSFPSFVLSYARYGLMEKPRTISKNKNTMLAMFHSGSSNENSDSNFHSKISVNGVIRKVTLSSPCLWASFHPISPLFSGIGKEKTFSFIFV